jgi:hypothetical protein|tara:strand:- start:504 stop:1100 length:597 start_codon:yes stop_codon:yes gene_type:complete
MTTTKALDGLRPSRRRGGAPNGSGMNEYPIASGTTPALYNGDIVSQSGGYVVALVTITQKAIGVFTGCRYVENGEPKWSNFWTAALSATDAKAMVVDDPSATFEIQADASVSIGDINGGQNFNIVNEGGSTVTGRSGFGIDASTRTTASAMLRPIAVIDVPGNNIDVAAERAYPRLEVRIVRHYDAYVCAGTSAPPAG